MSQQQRDGEVVSIQTLNAKLRETLRKLAEREDRYAEAMDRWREASKNANACEVAYEKAVALTFLSADGTEGTRKSVSKRESNADLSRFLDAKTEKDYCFSQVMRAKELCENTRAELSAWQSMSKVLLGEMAALDR